MNKVGMQSYLCPRGVLCLYLFSLFILSDATIAVADDIPKPTLRLNLSKKYKLDYWHNTGTPIFHQTTKGQLVLLPGFTEG